MSFKDGLDVAIIGVGAKTPIGLDAGEFWSGVIERRSGVREVPAERWDPAIFYDADPKAPDRSYSKIGGFVTGFEFDRKRYRLPPTVAEAMDRSQRLALAAVDEALADAGPNVDRARCAVVLGNSLGGDRRELTSARVMFPSFARALAASDGWDDLPSGVREKLLASIECSYKSGLPQVTEDTMPGELSNVIAGRIANVLDLGGSNYTVDAACASSLAAIAAAARALRTGECDVAVTGGTDASMGPPTYVKFCKIGALSPDGSRPFDARANGFVMGEGAAAFVLKRVEDAERDGDRIYAVIRSVGGSSDGRGKGITAPNPVGQKRAVARAYEAAGVDPSTVDLVEAHGTSTRVGDATEAAVLREFWGDSRKSRPVALGSIKSQIGHLKSAAGAAALLKTALAIHNRVLPPSINYERENPECSLTGSSFRVQTECADWPDPPDGGPRRAGVSAFGFGGTNFHVVLEEWRDNRASTKGKTTIAMPHGGEGSKGATETAMAETETVMIGREDVAKALVELLCAKTGYDAAEIQLDFELEADLGVDTVKQAEILAAVRERYGLPRDEKFRLADYPRLVDLVAYVAGRIERGEATAVQAAAPAPIPTRAVEPAPAPVAPTQAAVPDRAEVEKALVEVLCAKTGYDAAEIQLDFELEADLGVDTVKQAEILAAVRERYGLPRDEKFRLADYPRLVDLVAYVAGRIERGEATAVQAAAVQPPAPSAPEAAAAPPGGMPAEAAPDDPELAGAAIRVSGASRDELLARLIELAGAAERGATLRALAATCPDGPAGPWRAAFAACTPAEVAEQAKRAIECVETGKGRTTLPAKGVFLRGADDAPAAGGRTSFLFPGQGSQWVGMCRTLARRYPVVAETLAHADEVMKPILGRPLTDFIFGEGFGQGGTDPEAALRMTTITQPAMLACDIAIARLFGIHGVRPDLVAGHSLGEYAACVVAGTLDFAESLRIVAARGREMAAATPMGGDSGWMAAVAAPLEVVEEVIASTEGYLVAANKNSPSQTIIAGASDAVERAMKTFVERRIQCMRLPVSHAFHSSVVASASVPLRKVLDGSIVRTPALPIYSNVTAAPYPSDPDEIRALLARQVASPVEFIGIVRRMADDGATVFVESGPKKALSGFVAEILGGRKVVACPANLPKRGEIRSFLEALALLWVEGAAVRFAGDAAETVAAAAPEQVAPDRVAPPAVTAPVRPSSDGRRTPVVVSGLALGLPGSEDPFAPGNFDRMLAGETLFDSVPQPIRERMVRQNVERLVKDDTGEPRLATVDGTDGVIRVAARGRPVRLAEEYGVPEEIQKCYDATTRLAVAATLEALRDAGIPLVESRRPTSNGGFLAAGWRLPDAVGRETGVIFASAFPGYERLIAEIESRSNGGASRPFSRSFLLEVLSLGHAQVASLVGAMGPNVQVNAACASTSVALATAEDWIRAGRCRRVIVVGADDVTSDAMLPWIGAGFLATGAAATDDRAEDAALPFDRRRHGMLLGMGAVALVVETAEAAAERGVTPLVELLATRCGNSAGHALRLKPEHVAEVVDGLVGDVERLHGVDRGAVAARCMFMSHETYTPARGGSASAEVAALRKAFGDGARDMLVANTKGFTGHPMGAGLEDAVAILALVRREVPPIPNHREADPDLGDLNLSRGGRHEIDYALRLAAGFGSQVACAMYRRVADRLDGRIDAARNAAWLAATTGIEHPVTFVDKRTLRCAAAAPDDRPTARRERLDMGDLPGGFRAWGVVAEPAPAAAGGTLPPGALVVAHDGSPRAAGVIREIESRGMKAIPLPWTMPDADGSAVEAAVAAALGAGPFAGRIAGVVNTLGLATGCDGTEVHGRARWLYHMARVVERLCGGPPRGAFLATVVAYGGECGIGSAPAGTGAAAAVGGVTKALAREWPESVVKVLDVAPGATDRALVDAVLSEVSLADGLVEVGAGPRGRRTTALARTVDCSDAPALGPESVVVLTGGAGGITAAIGAEIARRHRCRIAVLDIVARPPDGAENLDLDAERASIRSRLAAAGDRVTPARVDAELAPLRRAKTAAAALAAYRAAGSDVHYEPCDLADGGAVAAAIDGVRRRFGRVDGVIHGAGAEESRPVSSKTPAGFDRVFAGKALGAMSLWEAVRADAPAFFVVFSSVAGRFGNAGQVDYCGANEVSARLAWHIRSSGGRTRALAIDWTGWDQIGMAVAGGMRALLLEHGVDLLPPSLGVPLAADMIERGVVGEVVVCGRLGALASPRFASTAVEAPPASAPPPPGVPQPARRPTCVPGCEVAVRLPGEAAVTLALDATGQSFLFDHVIDGVPVLPGVVGLELMAEAARAALGLGLAEPTALDVQFDRPVKVHPGRPVTVAAKAVRNADGSADCTLESHSVSATGRALDATHFRARFAAPPADGGGAGTIGFMDGLAARGPEAAEVYRWFFHGPSFRVIERASRIGEDGIAVRASIPAGGTAEIAGPRLREIALQAAGLWAMCRRGVMALPHRIGRAERLSVPKPGTPIVARVRATEGPTPATGDAAGARLHSFDVDLLGEDGRPFELLRGVVLIETGALPGGGPVAVPFFDSPEHVEVRLDVLGGAADEIALGHLGPAESSLYRQIGSRKRRVDWLGGRLAAKRLVASFLLETAGVRVPETDIGVVSDTHGAPDVRIGARPDLERLVPNVAISHGAGRAIAVLAPRNSGTRVGIDVEAIEPRDPSFSDHVLTRAEARLAGASGLNGGTPTLLWTVKEAVSKALGVGMTVDPRDIEVRDLRDGIAVVELSGDAAARRTAIGGRDLSVHYSVDGAKSTAWAVLDVDPSCAVMRTGSAPAVPEGLFLPGRLTRGVS